MPEAVQTYIDTKDIRQVVDVQAKILKEYRRDIAHYARHSALSRLMSDPEYKFAEALVFNEKSWKVEGKVLYLPIYMIQFLCADCLPEKMVYEV